MNKPIDREKFFRWLEDQKRSISDDLHYARKEKLVTWANELVEKLKLLKEIEKEIQSGAFDIESEPVLDLKPGDSVRHKEFPFLGVGKVLAIAKPMPFAKVGWSSSNFSHPLCEYYKVSDLEKVKDSDSPTKPSGAEKVKMLWENCDSTEAMIIETTLDYLGIKIPGINAPEKECLNCKREGKINAWGFCSDKCRHEYNGTEEWT